MYFSRPTRADLLLVSGYFLSAALALAITRFDGGVAFLWVSASLLIPSLARRRRRDWGTPLVLCGGASALATSWYGLGWSMALPFGVINMVEAYLGASLLVRSRSVQRPLGSLGWLANFILAVGIAAPLAAGLLAAVLLVGSGQSFTVTILHFWAGHALGNITFIPIVTMLISGEMSRMFRSLAGRHLGESLLIMSLVAAVTAAVFCDDGAPLLFLPCGPIILATFRGRQLGAALSIALLALIGGGMTVAGHGPMQLIDAPFGIRMQFFQFYLAAVVLTVLPVAADLKNRSRLYRELRFSEERYRLLADHSGDIMMHLRLDGTIRYVSPSIRQLGGYEPDSIVGKPATDLIAPEDIERVRQAHAETIAARGGTQRFDYRARTSDGRMRWFETHSRAILDRNGEVDGVLSVIRDVSERKAAEAKLTLAAMTDPLTGLPNRRAFQAASDVALSETGTAGPGCIAIVDLDHFKRVNDVHGHDAGDAVLRQFAAQAREALRHGDTVARLGGEEFGLLLPGACIQDATEICERLRVAVAAMGVPSATGMVRITMSGGVAELRRDGLDHALKRADAALYRAKAGGRDQLALAA